MLTLQVWHNEQDGWLNIQSVDTFEEGVYRLAYFYEHYFPPSKYQLIDENQAVVNQGRWHIVCERCRGKKYLAREMRLCYTCLHETTNDQLS